MYQRTTKQNLQIMFTDWLEWWGEDEKDGQVWYILDGDRLICSADETPSKTQFRNSPFLIVEDDNSACYWVARNGEDKLRKYAGDCIEI